VLAGIDAQRHVAKNRRLAAVREAEAVDLD
jgi:hypothetical protein